VMTGSPEGHLLASGTGPLGGWEPLSGLQPPMHLSLPSCNSFLFALIRAGQELFMWPFLSDAASTVEFVMLVGCVPMGVSHIVRPALWVEFFARLHAQGTAGLVGKVLAVELWP